MKKLEFKTSKGEFAILELPQGASELHIFNDLGRPYLSYRLKHETVRLYFEEGHWELFEKLEQLTEEQAKEVVDESMQSGLYAHYVKGVNPPNIYGYRRSINSIHTLLESLGVLFENPYPDMGFRYSREQKLYRIYEDKVWNKSNTYLFKKI